MTDSLTRRRMLQLTGGTAVVGLAGCTGTQNNDGGGANGTPTESGQDDTSTESGHSDEEDGHDEAVGAPSDTAEVNMITEDGGYHFEPHVVRVNVGGTVTWHNESGSHSTTAYHSDNDQPQLVPDGAAAWDSGLYTEQGATFEHTFETEGVYHYYCTPHESLGMIGSVIVGEPDPHEQVALEDPPADKPERVREKLEELNGMVSTALGDDHE
ncbi:cupredoxin domain-containing protein [Natrinema salsiterrestre]|uniref:Plastocyanin/azurin family copper-binding protein n=1 Tax=Natrinema salsiterrestre TaxID=2950540 RepID=A0A9Q4Q522_9EURY|nr:plastocyanin/azurin family copper-binding protein [Natrinema salsiterrestre]MDF9748127.1 plastocyanin/azurin family copper-binding protein [Natrinema salsiterrestre]